MTMHGGSAIANITVRFQSITDHQMIYSEVNPLNVNGNNTIFVLEDDKVEYAELNHQVLRCHASNPTKTCAAESINFGM